MTRTMAAALQTKLAASAINTLSLVTITVSAVPYRYCDWQESVTVASAVFSPLPFKYDAVNVEKSGRISKVSVTVPNLDGTVVNWIEATDIRSTPVTIQEVDTSYLDNPVTIFNGEIDSWAMTMDTVTFQVAEHKDYFGEFLPRRTYSPYCQLVFKGIECAYASTSATCGKQLSDCIERNNRTNFGGLYVPWALSKD